jgi:hypothetical protein
MKFRIVERSNFSGDLVFYPQYKKYFMWWDFWDFDFPPKRIEFYSLESATKFIKKQQNRPKENIYYLED